MPGGSFPLVEVMLKSLDMEFDYRHFKLARELLCGVVAEVITVR